MRRRLAVLPLAAAIAATSLAACGSSSKTSSSTTSPTTAAASGGSSTTTGGSSSGGSATIQTGNPTTAVTLNEDGSSLLSPYLSELVAPLKTAFPNVTLAPTAGGSGKGISDATNGVSDLGGTDAYLSPTQAANTSIANIPIVVSAQAINYNLPGVTNLKLSGDVIAQIYQGTITKWNDPAIAKLNPNVSLPSATIVPIHRSDSSGDTFLFTGFLSATNQKWSNSISYNTTVSWPNVSGEQTADGNSGMVSSLKATPDSIAYVGVSAESSAQADNLGEALIQNKNGQFESPTQAAINTEVNNSLDKVQPNLAANLIYGPGDGAYPIVNFEYLVVKLQQSDPNKALAIRDFFSVALDPTQGATTANLAKEGFVALPASILPKVNAAVNKIQG